MAYRGILAWHIVASWQGWTLIFHGFWSSTRHGLLVFAIYTAPAVYCPWRAKREHSCLQPCIPIRSHSGGRLFTARAELKECSADDSCFEPDNILVVHIVSPISSTSHIASLISSTSHIASLISSTSHIASLISSTLQVVLVNVGTT